MVHVRWTAGEEKMNKEELGLYTELQPFLKPLLGAWRQLDFGYDLIAKSRCVYLAKGKFQYPNGGELITDDTSTILRLPLPIDPTNPERGLWGMIDVTEVMKADDGWVVWIGLNSQAKDYYGATINLALLKAIKAQQEVKP